MTAGLNPTPPNGSDDTPQLDDIRLGNHDNPQQMIVILHGIATDHEIMRGVGNSFASALPEAAILIPRAPRKMALTDLRPKEREIISSHDTFDPDRAYSWFDIHPVRLPLSILFNRMQAIQQINDYIDTHLQKHDLSDDNLAIFGFSQGGALALYAAFDREKDCAAVVCHSGAYIGFRRAKAHPDTLMIIGDQDQLYQSNDRFSIKRFFQFASSINRLQRRNIPVENIVCHNLGHTANRESLTHSVTFIADRLLKAGPSRFPDQDDEAPGQSPDIRTDS